MTPTERAEKLTPLGEQMPNSPELLQLFREKIAAQIAEAEREAYTRGIGTECDKHKSGAWWCSTCSIDDLEKQKKQAYAEGFRAGQEEYKALHPGVARDLVSYQAGFNAAREKAKAMIDEEIGSDWGDWKAGKILLGKLAQRIGEMEP